MSERPTPGLFVTPGPGEDRRRRSGAPTIEPLADWRNLAPQSETDDEETKPIVPTQTAERPREIEVIEIVDDGENEAYDVDDPANEKYYLDQFKKWYFKHEVADKLREGYAKIFDTQAEQARPGTDLKQRMEEIAEKVRAVCIAYILGRDKATWFNILKRARDALAKEHEEVVKFCDSVQRPASKSTLQNGLMTETKARCAKMDRALTLREKIIKEMQVWSGQ